MRPILLWATQDVRLFFHARMLYHRPVDTGPTRRYRQHALTTHPQVLLLHADLAVQTLTALTPQFGMAVSQETRHGH